jgi:hypothetical protein
LNTAFLQTVQLISLGQTLTDTSFAFVFFGRFTSICTSCTVCHQQPQSVLHGTTPLFSSKWLRLSNGISPVHTYTHNNYYVWQKYPCTLTCSTPPLLESRGCTCIQEHMYYGMLGWTGHIQALSIRMLSSAFMQSTFNCNFVNCRPHSFTLISY